MSAELIKPGTLPGLNDLESLAMANSHYFRDRLKHGYPIDENMRAYTDKFREYSELIGSVTTPEDPAQAAAVANLGIMAGALMARDLLDNPHEWGIDESSIFEAPTDKLIHFVQNAPLVYLAERETLSGFVNQQAGDICPQQASHCYRAGRTALGLIYLLTDDFLLNKYIETEAASFRYAIDNWPGNIPD